jgi:hypothetical protein
VVISAVNGLPSSELIEAVKENLYGHELMAFDVRVKATEITPVDLQIEYSGEVSEGAVMLVAETYIFDLGIGGRFKINDLYDLYKPLKLKTVEIISPDRDVQPNEDSIVVATIQVTKVVL